MSLKSSKAYNDSYERLIADAIKRCRITAIRCVDTEAKDGKPFVSTDWITFALDEQAKTIDGEVLEPGFPKEVGFNTYPHGTNGDSGLDQAHRMNEVLQRKFVVAALGLSANCRDAAEELEKRGGVDALIGKLVLVKWRVNDTKSGKRQNVVDILPTPAVQVQ